MKGREGVLKISKEEPALEGCRYQGEERAGIVFMLTP